MENYFIKVDGNQVAFASGQDDKNPLCVNYLAKGLLAIDNNVYVRNDENRFEYRGNVEQTAVFDSRNIGTFLKMNRAGLCWLRNCISAMRRAKYARSLHLLIGSVSPICGIMKPI